MATQKPEKHLKNLRPRKKALEGIIPPEAEYVFRRPRPERCWIEDGRIMLVESSWFDVAPLKDPKLFLSFVQLGVYGGEYKAPSEVKIKGWVERYGLPAKRL